MVTILIALFIPVTAFVTGYFTLKGVQLGLNHQSTPKLVTPVEDKSQVQDVTSSEQTIENPIQAIFQEKPKDEQDSIINEWFNGAEK